jgi:NADH dehydrogenase
MWLFVHVTLLIGFRSRLAVMGEWAWAYFTRERSARLIIGGTESQAWAARPPANQDAVPGVLASKKGAGTRG